MRGLLSSDLFGSREGCKPLFVRCFGGIFASILEVRRKLCRFIFVCRTFGTWFCGLSSDNLSLALNSRQIYLFLGMCVLGRVRICARFTTLEKVGGKNNMLLCWVNMHLVLLIQCGSSLFVRLGISFTEEVFNFLAFALLLECRLRLMLDR